MVTKITFKLDKDGIRGILNSADMKKVVDGVSEDIADKVRSELPEGVEVNTHDYSTDRVANSVMIADPRGMTWQAEKGVFTKAAHSVGAEFKGSQ